jgi:hypothetical protein
VSDNQTSAAVDDSVWPHRTLILLAVGAAAVLAIQQLTAPEKWADFGWPLPLWRTAVATGIAVGALAFGFGLSRVRRVWTLFFAVGLGLVSSLIIWWNGQPGGWWSWSGASLLLAIAIAVPLFQVARDEGRWSFPYPQTHGHAWTNVVLWGACWLFVGIALLLAHLLGELFALIGIGLLKDLLRHNWSNALLIGAAFGTALGLLRDRDRVVGLLQRVVNAVLSVLAPVLATALLLFVLSLPFTGLGSLWGATKSTTPTLMACVTGALVLANAVIGHGDDDEAKGPVLRWSALGLGVVILPLAIIAAIAMGLRLHQYGMTPDRLWGVVCVVFAVGYGLVYLVAVVRKRQDWGPLIRRENIRLAFATMGIALLLATPVAGFNAISTRDQVVRLKSGKVGVDRFDWAALAFDFGDPGRRALADLQRSSNPAIRNQANITLKADGRYSVELASEAEAQRFKGSFEIRPAGATLPEALKVKITAVSASPSYDWDDSVPCKGTVLCRVYMQPDGSSAAVIGDGCMSLPVADRIDPKHKCSIDTAVFVLRGTEWTNSNKLNEATEPKMIPDQERASLKSERDAVDTGKVEVRNVTQRQLFVGDKPVGQPFKQP